MLLKDKAIVLGSMPYQERSRIVYLLTENHGKLSGIARGSIHSRRFGAAFDLFNCLQIEYEEKASRSLVNIKEASIYYAFPKLRKSLYAISTASYFLDLCKRVTELHAPAREIFLCLANYLYLLEQIDMRVEILRSFELKLLNCLGCAPSTNYCSSCKIDIDALHQRGENLFHLLISYGGIFCSSCYKKQEKSFSLSRKAVLWMSKIKNIKIQELQHSNALLLKNPNELQFMPSYFEYHCNNIKIQQIPSYMILKKFLSPTQVHKNIAN